MNEKSDEEIDDLNDYEVVYSVYSSALINMKIKELYIYDPTLTEDRVLKVFFDAKIFT